jgi:hypothetical protein
MGVGTKDNWIKINERLLELERKGILTSDETNEWNILIEKGRKVPGVIVRNRKNEDNSKTFEENREEKGN